MSKKDEIQKAADRIWNAQQEKLTCLPIRDLLGETDINSAYEAQRINTKRKLDRGEKIIGCKIGLTSFAVQKQLGVEQPDFGILTDKMHVEQAASIQMSDLMQAKVEAEIAFILSKDITEPVDSISALSDSIDYALAAIEIVGSRIESWNIRITDTIADNASASHFVLGEKRVKLSEVNLEACAMKMTRFGEVVSTGDGKACMGNPLNAALWLANTMIANDAPLKQGDIILSGALGPMVNVAVDDEFHAEIEGLGAVSVFFRH